MAKQIDCPCGATVTGETDEDTAGIIDTSFIQ